MVDLYLMISVIELVNRETQRLIQKLSTPYYKTIELFNQLLTRRARSRNATNILRYTVSYTIPRNILFNNTKYSNNFYLMLHALPLPPALPPPRSCTPPYPLLCNVIYYVLYIPSQSYYFSVAKLLACMAVISKYQILL